MADQYRDRPFQADQDYGRDDDGRDFNAPQRRPESDPLAELARLIGQTDPFSTFGRDGQPARHDEYGADDTGGYDDEPVNQPAWMRNRTPEQNAGDGEESYAKNEEQRYADIKRHYDEGPNFDQPSPDRNAARYEEVLFGQPGRDQHAEAPFPPARERYADDRFGQPHYDDDDADDEAPPRRRGGTMTVVVVMLLAVVGTAAAFGYRTFIGSPRSGEPPVIKADAAPNKVMSSGDGKQINDRIGDKAGERMVSREEQPVDLGGKAQPRVVFPPLAQNNNPPNASSANTATRPTGAGIANGTINGEEPRKIRTLTIRPDQPDATPTAATSSAPVPTSRAPSNSASAATPAGGPIALTPPPRAPVAETRPKVASISPSPSTGGGSYVQVSSQKTEADAQSSFKAIQSKYSEVLASKPSTIRRADLGDKGVFYRALVGPFGTTDEATQFCVNLKAAGGQCIVQRN